MLPVVFPDGSTAELSYPRELRLAQLGVQPAVSAGILKGESRVVQERFLRIGKFEILELRWGQSPIETYRGTSGPVEVWRARKPRDLLVPTFMAYRFDSWKVIVGDGNAGSFMGRENRRIWANKLAGYENDSGFLVIDPLPPLALTRDTGLILHGCFEFLELRLEGCRDLKSRKPAKNTTVQKVGAVTVHRNKIGRQFYANWCTPSKKISVYVDDRDKRFVDLVVKGLKVRNVQVNRDANVVPRT